MKKLDSYLNTNRVYNFIYLYIEQLKYVENGLRMAHTQAGSYKAPRQTRVKTCLIRKHRLLSLSTLCHILNINTAHLFIDLLAKNQWCGFDVFLMPLYGR